MLVLLFLLMRFTSFRFHSSFKYCSFTVIMRSSRSKRPQVQSSKGPSKLNRVGRATASIPSRTKAALAKVKHFFALSNLPPRVRIWFSKSSMAMLAFSILGVVFAISHHAFYNSLAGKPIPTGNVFNHQGVRLSTQQFNIAVGNTFAFLVKACLSAAISVAYVQLFWQTILRQSQRISTVDTIFDSLTNVFALMAVRTWWTHPLLFFLFLTAWYVCAHLRQS